MKEIKLLIVIAILVNCTLNAQEVKSTAEKYMRSSLYVDLISLDDEFGGEVARQVSQMPFPDKYNKHNSDAVNSENMLRLFDTFTFSNVQDVPDLDVLFQNYIDESNLENQLIATWFNRKRDGTFDMNLVAERGFYDASLLEADIVSKTIRGRAALADAGENLIQNTFVLLGLTYVNGNHKKFVIGSQARLYKLSWNKEKAEKFYSEYWIPKGSFSLKKRKAFEEMELFNLEYVGGQSHVTTEKVSRVESIIELPNRRYFTKRLPRQIEDKKRFKTLLTRHFDEVYAMLQEEYPVFRVITPLVNVEPLQAQIGMKEGLKGGEKFEVLEQVFNEKTGQTSLKRKGVIKAMKGKVWDNRYNAGEEGSEAKKGATQFEGRGNFYPGMLIRQID